MSATQLLARHVAEVDRRRSARAEIVLDTLMADREGRVFGARILNLSEHGFMAQVEADLCERAPVRLDLPTIGWLRADIIWELGTHVGGAFRRPIDPQSYAALVRTFG